MPVGDDTFAYRSRLPHLRKSDKTYDVTFCTQAREILPPRARDLVLESCIHDHLKLCWVDTVVVMPEHVHLIAFPYDDVLLTDILERMKGASVHRVNREVGRKGKLWQRDSWDRILRSYENLIKKREYIRNNPVRAGLVERWEDYPWIWPRP